MTSDSGIIGPVIYHGTPMTPRAALLDVCAGRAMCVSFYRPDDVEAVEAISPAIMFRQRRFLVLEASYPFWAGLGGTPRLGELLQVARCAVVSSWQVGSNPGHARRAKPAQRCAAGRMAVWPEGCAAVAYGRPDRATAQAVRPLRSGLFRLDRRGQGRKVPGVLCADGRGRTGARQPMAGVAYDAGNYGGSRLSFYQCGQHQPSAERMEI